MYAGLIIVITDGNQVRMVEQAGFRSTYLRDTERLNNFVMGMISVCLTASGKSTPEYASPINRSQKYPKCTFFFSLSNFKFHEDIERTNEPWDPLSYAPKLTHTPTLY